MVLIFKEVEAEAVTAVTAEEEEAAAATAAAAGGRSEEDFKFVFEAKAGLESNEPPFNDEKKVDLAGLSFTGLDGTEEEKGI
jgi:hypothetical protein